MKLQQFVVVFVTAAVVAVIVVEIILCLNSLAAGYGL